MVQSPAADDEWWARQHPNTVYMDHTSKRALDALGNRINLEARRPWTYDIGAWSAILGLPYARRGRKQAPIANCQAEQESLSVLAAAAPSRGMWARPSVVAHQDSAAAYAKAAEGSKLLDILSMLGSPSDSDCEPVSDAEILAAIDAPGSRGIDGVDRGSGVKPPDPAAPAVDGQATEGHPSVYVTLNLESFVDDKGRT